MAEDRDLQPSSPERADRRFDIVLFGATGFTGGLTAEYLARAMPPDGRWALAGRNQAKLTAVRDRLTAVDATLGDLELLAADVTDPDSLRAVAERTRVVITTVGPYLQYGEPLVAACAEAGTDYVDLTGEPEFVDRMYLAHHDRAVATGARIVHACGFDSVPHDLGVLFTVEQLPDDVPLEVRGVVHTNARFSSGTLQSALGQLARLRDLAAAARDRKRAERAQPGKRARIKGAPGRDPYLGLWLLPFPGIDAQIVTRSARMRPEYGPDFTYGHYAGFQWLPSAAATALGAGAMIAAAQVSPLRRRLGALVPAGDGPSAQRRADTWFTVDVLGEGGGQRVRTQVSGGDPGYDETAKMLAESAISLAFDDNPRTAGQVTTATAMGDNLIRRLRAAGITFTRL